MTSQRTSQHLTTTQHNDLGRPAEQPVGPDQRFATIHLSTGVRLHYAEQGDPSGETIVFLHGYSDSWYSFSRLLPLLPTGYHAYALDERGHGDSDRPEIGHSMGSLIARRVAETYPERVTRLVIIGSPLTPVNQGTLEIQAIVRELTDPVSPDFVREFQASMAYVPLPEPFFERVITESLKLPARVWQSVLDGVLAFDHVAELGRITAPTLIMWGERDALFPRTGQERLATLIPGARLTIYPETGHTPQWERPERVAADLEAFIGGTSLAFARAGGALLWRYATGDVRGVAVGTGTGLPRTEGGTRPRPAKMPSQRCLERAGPIA